MTKISRTDEAFRSEKGGEVFDEFLNIIKNNEILFNSIASGSKIKVEDVVADYRKAVGLDLVKTASKSQKRLISKRAGVLEIHPDIKTIIDSYCQNTGGTKSIHSIISFLRERFGNEIKFTDQELKNYIDNRKNHFKTHHGVKEFNAEDVGKVGLESDNNYDTIADYYKSSDR